MMARKDRLATVEEPESELTAGQIAARKAVDTKARKAKEGGSVSRRSKQINEFIERMRREIGGAEDALSSRQLQLAAVQHQNASLLADAEKDVAIAKARVDAAKTVLQMLVPTKE